MPDIPALTPTTALPRPANYNLYFEAKTCVSFSGNVYLTTDSLLYALFRFFVTALLFYNGFAYVPVCRLYHCKIGILITLFLAETKISSPLRMGAVFGYSPPLNSCYIIIHNGDFREKILDFFENRLNFYHGGSV